MEPKPSCAKLCYSETCAVLLLSVLLIASEIVVHGGGSVHAAPEPSPRASAQERPSESEPNMPVTSNSRETVTDRLSRLKSRHELMEQNKRFPMLHEDQSQFTESVEVVATGYYAGVESTGKHPGHPEYGITFSGVKVRQGVLSTIAADPKVFPLGTILYIPGYGYGIVADTGSAIKGYKIDLYYKTKDQIYKEWGKRTVRVFVVKKGDGRVSEETLDRWDDVLTAVSSRRTIEALDL